MFKEVQYLKGQLERKHKVEALNAIKIYGAGKRFNKLEVLKLKCLILI